MVLEMSTELPTNQPGFRNLVPMDNSNTCFVSSATRYNRCMPPKKRNTRSPQPSCSPAKLPGGLFGDLFISLSRRGMSWTASRAQPSFLQGQDQASVLLGIDWGELER